MDITCRIHVNRFSIAVIVLNDFMVLLIQIKVSVKLLLKVSIYPYLYFSDISNDLMILDWILRFSVILTLSIPLSNR